MMNKVILILLALTLFLAVSASAEEEPSFLGKPFQDFTVTDTDGVCLMDYSKMGKGENDPDMIQCYIARSPGEIDTFADALKASGYGRVTVEYETETGAGSRAEAYIIHVLDQNGDPVPEVFVNFCTDTACAPCESDEDGTIVYTGKPDVYHVQIIDCPEGYSCDEAFEMYTPETYGEWVLRLRRD